MKKIISLLLLVSLIFSPLLAFAATDITAGAPRAIVVDPTSAAYQQQLGTLYTGYGAPGPQQNGVTGSLGGCVGSFVGSWIGSQMGGTMKSMFTSKTSQAVPVADVNQAAANYRDETTNGIAFCIGNGLITIMTQSIVQWINSGFKNPDGTKGPAFLSNPSQFWGQVMDREIGNFFQGLGPIGNIVCKPFDLNIRLAILNQYSGRSQCTLTSIKQNFARFGGNNSNTYMQNWIHLTQENGNNYMGSYFDVKERLSDSVTYNVSQNKLDVDLGKGFMSFKKCSTYSSTVKDPNTGKPECTAWTATTPGAEVQATVDRAMGAQTQRLAIATNFNQIVSALVAQLIKMAVGGLTGANNTPSFNTASNYPATDVNNLDNYISTVATTSTSTISATTSTSTEYLWNGEATTTDTTGYQWTGGGTTVTP